MKKSTKYFYSLDIFTIMTCWFLYSSLEAITWIVTINLLQDQWDRVQEHTEHGLEFTKKCQEFVRDRIKLEVDYAKSLRYVW